MLLGKEISIYEGINSVYSLKQEDLIFLTNYFTKIELPKQTKLIIKGEICDKLYFLSKGCCRSFYALDNKNVTLWLGHEGDFLTSFKSWMLNEPSHETIELCENGTLYYITYTDMMFLCKENHAINIFYRHLIEAGLIYWENRSTMLLFKSAKERLQNLIDRYPMVMQRWQLSHIASYLGITQETLSRLRSER